MFGELISVKEYADRHGMTEQAVYKQLRAGKLQGVEMTESGKAKKYIFVPSQDTAPAAHEAQDSTPAALAELAIKALTSQLDEKDKQIDRLTQLLENSQQLQAHSQKMLEAAPQDTGKPGIFRRLFGSTDRPQTPPEPK